MRKLVGSLCGLYLVFSVGCVQSSADPTWAHLPPIQRFVGEFCDSDGECTGLMGSVLARLVAAQKGIAVSPNDFAVCIANHTEFADPKLVLESKLAVAAWLDAGGFEVDTWNSIRFVSQPSCDRQDARWSAVVTLGGDEYGEVFEAIELVCSAGNEVPCWVRPRGYVVGLGAPGFFQEPWDGGWDALEFMRPSFTILSPHIAWTSLDETVVALSMNSSDREALLVSYADLLHSSSPSFDSLVAFHRTHLQETALFSPDDLDEERIIREFRESGETLLQRPYKPRSALFHTLVHELGHQFGLDHPDNPGSDSIVGESADTELRQAWYTDLAVMAYGDNYLSIRPDDKAGVMAARKQVESFFQSRQ